MPVAEFRSCVVRAQTDNTLMQRLVRLSFFSAPRAVSALPSADAPFALALVHLLGVVASGHPADAFTSSARIDSVRIALLSATTHDSASIRAAAIRGLRRFSQPEVRLAVQARHAIETDSRVQGAVQQWFAVHGPWQPVVVEYRSSARASPSQNETLTRSGRDSLAAGRARMDELTRVLIAERASLPSRLRPDSGTTKADQIFAAWRLSYLERASITDTLVEILACPFCETAMRARGERNMLEARPTPPRDSVVRDSLTAYIASLGFHATVGEGDVYIRPGESPLLIAAERFLTPPMQRFMRISALASDQSLGGDGSIALNWDELGDRLAVFEDLETNHPGLAARDEVRDEAGRYRELFFRGSDNTRLFDRGVMPVHYRRSFARFAAHHSALPSGRAAGEFLRLLAASGYRETPAIRAFLQRFRSH